jgi:hypothetical protein
MSRSKVVTRITDNLFAELEVLKDTNQGRSQS